MENDAKREKSPGKIDGSGRRLRAVGYCRVSVANGNGDSLDAQAEAIHAWVEREGAELLAVHADDGLSGTLDASERPGLTAALADLEKEADALVVHRLDRLARELHVQEAVLARAWSAGARVYSVVDGEILQDDPDDPMRTFVRQVMGAAAQLERGMIRARMQGGRRRRRAQGRFIGGSRPYGYALVEDEDGVRLDPIPEEQAVIGRMVELREGGATLQAIADDLNGAGVRPPGGRIWYPATVARVIERAREGVLA